ncbi:MAG: TetR/AcrR family transcriptional regulator [Kangiellaceae bacterium]|jgi:AcrR family transcriptional regulator|nr:TetR/AcrR family transcriptional regulator [Kangiellaceae bacterium]
MVLVDRKQREFERREEDILDAALLLFSQPNWESVSIEKVAKQAQIGKGTVYKHFESKDELLFRLMLRFYQGMLQALPFEKLAEMPLVDGFRHILPLAFNYHLENREYRYIVEYTNRIDFKSRAKKEWRDAFKVLDEAFGEKSDPAILAAMDQGLIERRSLNELHIGMHACFEGTINMLWAGNDWFAKGNSEQIIEGAINFMISGLIGNLNNQ